MKQDGDDGHSNDITGIKEKSVVLLILVVAILFTTIFTAGVFASLVNAKSSHGSGSSSGSGSGSSSGSGIRFVIRFLIALRVNRVATLGLIVDLGAVPALVQATRVNRVVLILPVLSGI
jgi:hypothetical protein